MSVFSVSDLHLSGAVDKPMDIFGDHWQDHWGAIMDDWSAKVTDDDIVIIAGDISWAMNYEQAKVDLDAICNMPGHKVMIKGNHDYWHGSISKTREILFNKTYFIQNDAVKIGKFTFAGARGWVWQEDASPEDKKIYRRELERLRLSLSAAKKMGGEMIGVSHYPPFSQGQQETEVTALYEEFGVKTVLYGHLHGQQLKEQMPPVIQLNGAEYHLTSCDFLQFKLKQVF